MIAQLTGTITLIGNKYILIDVSGVGYKVAVTADTARLLGKQTKQKDKVSILTHLAVRENALDLYGFLHQSELELFLMLIEISGIGPKSALVIMGQAGVETLKKPSLRKMFRISPKFRVSAKNRPKNRPGIKRQARGGRSAPPRRIEEESDAVLALQSLGYSQGEAREALKKVDEK